MKKNIEVCDWSKMLHQQRISGLYTRGSKVQIRFPKAYNQIIFNRNKIEYLCRDEEELINNYSINPTRLTIPHFKNTDGVYHLFKTGEIYYNLTDKSYFGHNNSGDLSSFFLVNMFSGTYYTEFDSLNGADFINQYIMTQEQLIEYLKMQKDQAFKIQLRQDGVIYYVSDNEHGTMIDTKSIPETDEEIITAYNSYNYDLFRPKNSKPKPKVTDINKVLKFPLRSNSLFEPPKSYLITSQDGDLSIVQFDITFLEPGKFLVNEVRYTTYEKAKLDIDYYTPILYNKKPQNGKSSRQRIS